MIIKGDDDGWDIRPRGNCGATALVLLVGLAGVVAGVMALVGALVGAVTA